MNNVVGGLSFSLVDQSGFQQSRCYGPIAIDQGRDFVCFIPRAQLAGADCAGDRFDVGQGICHYRSISQCEGLVPGAVADLWRHEPNQ